MTKPDTYRIRTGRALTADEIDHIRSALDWAVQADPVTGAGIVSAFTRVYWMYSMEADSRRSEDRGRISPKGGSGPRPSSTRRA